MLDPERAGAFGVQLARQGLQDGAQALDLRARCVEPAVIGAGLGRRGQVTKGPASASRGTTTSFRQHFVRCIEADQLPRRCDPLARKAQLQNKSGNRAKAEGLEHSQLEPKQPERRQERDYQGEGIQAIGGW